MERMKTSAENLAAIRDEGNSTESLSESSIQGRHFVPEQLGVGVLYEIASSKNAEQELLKLLPAGSRILYGIDRIQVSVIQLPAGTDVLKAAADLSGKPGIDFAEPIYIENISWRT